MIGIVAGGAHLWGEPAVVATKAVSDERLARLETQTDVRPVDTLLELALAYDERGQAARAADYYRQAAAEGVGVAELRLGWFEESGLGGDQNYTLARAHYERAASQGVPEANLRIGLLYLEGWGTPRDVAAAVSHLQLAADAGYQPAQQILSEMYFAGLGVDKDLGQALVWAEKAAARKNAEAQALVGAIRQKAARLPDDVRTAREWYQLSAEQEFTAGMRAMASTFLQPNARPEEVSAGLRWLELAADNGDAMARFYLAGLHLWHPQLRQAAGSIELARGFLTTAAHGGELAAAEVLQLAEEGLSLADAFRYVQSVPVEARYIQRLAARQPTASELEQHLVRPRPIKMVNPVYPAAMRLARTEGNVVVEFTIDQTGRVRDARAISSTHQAFADLAVSSVTAWRFLAGTKDGRPVNTRVQIQVIFTLAGAGGLDVARFRSDAAGG